MPGRASQSKPLQYVGAVVALIAVVGTVVFDWEFGASDGVLPVALGIASVVLVVGWAVSQRR